MKNSIKEQQLKVKIEEVTRDLGVFIANDCKPSAHVNKISKKDHGVLSQIRQAMIVRDRSSIISLYRSFVRPLLETAASVWNPANRGDVETLEKSRAQDDK